MINKKDVTLIVSSCDKYEDAWDPFFRLWNKQWPDFPYRIILNTEYKPFYCDYLSIESVQTGDQETWIQRLKAAIEIIDSEFVLFSLEDFFLLSPVNIPAWNKAVEYMKKNPKVGFLWFPSNENFQPKNYKKELEPNFYITKRNTLNRVNATIGLWRKEFLLQMLFKNGDPWFFERSALFLSKLSDFSVAFWDQKNCPVFNYRVNPKYGYGIVRGKWLSKNQELFEAHNISVNFERLGVINEEVTYQKLGLDNNGPEIHKKKFRLYKKIKHKVKELKRMIKVYPSFKKYCNSLKVNKN